jgi:hypothetical protein
VVKRIGQLEAARDAIPSGRTGEAAGGAADNLTAESTRLRTEFDALAARVKELESLKELVQDVSLLKQKVHECTRLATESSIAIQGLLENELLHRQMIDAHNGDGQ